MRIESDRYCPHIDQSRAKTQDLSGNARRHPDCRYRPACLWTAGRVPPKGADAAAWAAAIGVIRKPAPPYEGRLLHGDFQPGNVLFDVPPPRSAGARITGVVDWAKTSWGPTDFDVAHCSTDLALLHGAAWGLSAGPTARSRPAFFLPGSQAPSVTPGG
ncbi:phosphotransferase [Nonomuraea sp. NPDC003201]